MRILLIANTLPHTDISGVGEQVVQLAEGLSSLGHEVMVLGRGGSGAHGPKVLFPLMSVPAFLREVYRFRPHVVQVHESDGALVALAARILEPMLDPPPRIVALMQVSYVREIRAVRALRGEGRVLGRPSLEERVFQWLKGPVQVGMGWLTAWLAETVLSPSHRTAEEVALDYFTSPVRVLPNVTGMQELAKVETVDLPRAGHLLFVGRLRIRKGVEVLLHAISRLRDDVPELRLVVAGEGEHRERLKRTARELELDDCVVFLGRCSPHRVRALMRGARALVVPSIYEGMPLVILEAMREALPAVASAVSGIPEVIQDGETGWLVPPENIGALTMALRDVYARPEEAHRRGLAAERWVRETATPEDAARLWLDLVSS